MMKRLLTYAIALVAMMMVTVDANAWTAVAFRSTLDNNWKANTSDGKIMTRMNDNQFYIDIEVSGDVSFRFFVSDGENWLIPNNGDGTVATHNTEVWGNSGNSSTNACFKLVPGTYTKFRINLTWKNQGGDGKHYWVVNAVPQGSGGGDSNQAYYLVSPSINNGQKCEYLKFYPSRNRTRDGWNGNTDYRYWAMNFKYDDIKRIDPNAPETFSYYIVDKNGNAVCRPWDNNYQLGKSSSRKKYCNTYQNDDNNNSGIVEYQTYDDTKTNANGSNMFKMSTTWGKSFTLFLDTNGNRPLTMNINPGLEEDRGKKYYLIGNLFKGTADAGAAWSPTDPQMRMLMERHEYADSIVYTATVKRPSNGWANVYMDVCPDYLLNDGTFSDNYDWQHVYRPQIDPVVINSVGSKDAVAPHGGLAVPGMGANRYDMSSINPKIDNDVESFIFSMNVTTATYRIDYVHDLYIVGDAVEGGTGSEDASTYWDGAKAVKMNYDANKGYWTATVTMKKRGFFRFANDMKMSSSFGENGYKPQEPNNPNTGMVGEAEAETQYVNKVSYYSEATATHNAAMNRNDIQFWLEDGTYTIKFHAQAQNNGTATSDDIARTFYVIDRAFTFHTPVNRNAENLTNLNFFKAFSNYHVMKKPADVKMYTVSNVDDTYKTVLMTELRGDYIPAGKGLLLATETSYNKTAEDIAIDVADDPWDTNAPYVPEDNLLVPHFQSGSISSTADTPTYQAYNYIFGYRVLNTTPSGKVTLGFYKPTGNGMPGNSAYLQIPVNITYDAPAFKLVLDEEPVITGINNINTQKADNSAFYTLQGIRVAAPEKGVYIHNGKKVIVK